MREDKADNARQKWYALAALLMATLMGFLDLFIVNVAAPSIQKDLNANFKQLQLVLSGYILAYAVGLVLGGKAGDLWGRKKIFLGGVTAFGAASVACALAPNADLLIVCRILQGTAAAMMLPQVLSTIQAIFPARLRAKAIGLYGSMIGFAAAIGQLVGGVLIQLNIAQLSWRPIFLVNVPITILTLLVGMRYIPQNRSQTAVQLDWVGAVLLGCALALLLYPFISLPADGWSMAYSFMVVGAVISFGYFVYYEHSLEKRNRQPLLRLGLVKERSFAIGLLVVFTFYGGNAGFFFVLAYFLQYGEQLNALGSGLGFLPIGVGFMAASLLAQVLVKKFGAKVLVLAALCMGASFVIGWGTLQTSANAPNLLWLLTPFLLLSGIGEGLVAAPLIATILAGVAPSEAGAASGTLLTMTQIANVTSVALIGGIYASLVTSAANQPQLHAFMGCLYVLLALSLITAGLLVWLTRKAPRQAQTT